MNKIAITIVVSLICIGVGGTVVEVFNHHLIGVTDALFIGANQEAIVNFIAVGVAWARRDRTIEFKGTLRCGDLITCVAFAVVIAVRLVGVKDIGTVITNIANFVAVLVGLVGIVV